MNVERLKLLLIMARAGLSARAERMPANEIAEAAHALTEGEAWLVVLSQKNLTDQKAE